VSCGAGAQALPATPCVNITDPATGCAAASCAPCAFATRVVDLRRDRRVRGGWGARRATTIATPCRPMAAKRRSRATVSHCGACGRACAADNVLSKQCAGGLCVSTCNVSHGNCSYPYSAADDGLRERDR